MKLIPLMEIIVMKVFKKLKDKMMALMKWKGLEMPWPKRKPNL